MRCLIQRVTEAKVTVDGATVGEIGKGYLILLGVEPEDEESVALALARKAVNLRIFEDENGKMNRSLADVGGRALIVSQFTLCADCRHGNRPSFTTACEPRKAQALYEAFCESVRGYGVGVEKGVFGADMQVSLVNDGPVTILLDSRELGKGSAS